MFPGGGGYDLEQFKSLQKPYHSRNLILVKGNENRSGRALNVLKALERCASYLSDFEVVVFGATHPKVFRFRESKVPNIQVHGLLKHEEVQKLMGTAAIYIGNSNSDGMPNTLLEAICSGAYPIQSNPGGATAEMIENGVNGWLIEDCEDVRHIEEVLKKVLQDKNQCKKAVERNLTELAPNLERAFIKERVLAAYGNIL